MNTTDYSSRWHSFSARVCVPAHICKQCLTNTGWPTGPSWRHSCANGSRSRSATTHPISWPMRASGRGRHHTKSGSGFSMAFTGRLPHSRAWHAGLSKVLSNDHHGTCERDGAADELSECLHDVLPSLFKENIDGAAVAIARGLANFMHGIGKKWAVTSPDILAPRSDLLRTLPGQASRISHRRVEVTATRKITGGFRK